MSSQPPRPHDWSRPSPAGPGPSWPATAPLQQGRQDVGPPQVAPPRSDLFGGRYDGPGDPAAGAGGPGGDPRGDLDGRRDVGGRGRKAAAAAGLVAMAVAGSAGGYWLGHRGGGTTVAAAASPAASPSVSASVPAPVASASTRQKVPLSAVAEVDAADARSQLKKAGLAVVGRGTEAWTWTDTNGRNMLLATRSVDKAEGKVVRAATLRVYQVAGLDGTPKTVLTPLRDSGETNCDVDFLLDFVPGSIQVSDTDGDGNAEASVGWVSLCAGDPEPERVKLALLTKGTYFILRGSGQRSTDPVPPPDITFPKASFTPNVPAASWPAGSYQKTVDLFHTLFK